MQEQPQVFKRSQAQGSEEPSAAGDDAPGPAEPSQSISGQDNADEDPRVDDIEIVLSPTFRDMVEGAETIEHVNAVDRAYKILKAVQEESLS